MDLSEYFHRKIVDSYGDTNGVTKYLKSDMFERWIDDWYKETFQRPPPTWLSKRFFKKEEQIREDE